MNLRARFTVVCKVSQYNPLAGSGGDNFKVQFCCSFLLSDHLAECRADDNVTLVFLVCFLTNDSTAATFVQEF